MVLGWGSKRAQTHDHDDEDMSMEEILASIRKYVSEETTAKDSDRVHEAAKVSDSPYRVEAEIKPSKRIVDDHATEFAPTNSFETSSLFSENTSSKNNDFAVTRETLKTKPALEDVLAQASSPAATSNPFAKLAEVSKIKTDEKILVEPKANITLDQLIADLARPMVQKWLDQNMTQIVENMVAQEISKMTGRK